MAVVTDSLVATLSRTTIVRAPDYIRELTAWPRAVTNFAILNGVLSAKPLNDQQTLLVSIVLPPSFAYKLVDFNASALQDVANDWDAFGMIEITNGYRQIEAGATQRHSIQIDKPNRGANAEAWIARPPVVEALPRYVIQAVAPGISPVIVFRVTNSTAAAGAAGTTNFLAAFYEYDIEQVQRFPMHFSPDTFPR